MASYNFHFRPSTKEGYHMGKLFIRVVHRRDYKNIPTSYSIFPHEWNEKSKKLVVHPDNIVRSTYLSSINKLMKRDLEKLESSLSKLSQKGDYSVLDILESYKECATDDTLDGFCNALQNQMLDNGQYRTARGYRSTVNSFLSSVEEPCIKIKEIDEAAIEKYNRFLVAKNLSMNTISFYMRTLRAILNKASDAGLFILLPGDKLFKKVFTGNFQTKKRALNNGELKALTTTMSDLDSAIALASDMPAVDRSEELHYYQELKGSLLFFLFCFHARGMSYIDMAHLTRHNVKGSIITYRRKKTGRPLTLRITKPMSEILEYFQHNRKDSDYLFPLLDSNEKNKRVLYETELRKQNENLHRLSLMAGIDKKITTHVSRHTYATMLKNDGVPISKICELLGHQSERTTMIYLDSLDQNEIDSVSERMSRMAKVKFKKQSAGNHQIAGNKKSVA